MSDFSDPTPNFSNQAGMPYQPGPPAKTSGMAITSLVLGVLSCGFSLLTGIPAIILGIIALVGISRSAGRMGGTVLAVVGMVLGGFSVISGAILVALLLPAVMSVRHVAEEVQSKNNLRQIGHGPPLP